MTGQATTIPALILVSIIAFSVGQVSFAQTPQLNVVLVLDVSGSMRNVVPEWNVTKAEVQLNAARSFVENADSNWRVGVVEYRENAFLRSGLTLLASPSTKEAVASSMSGTSRGDTNLGDGITLAASILAEASEKRVMIVVGDGNPNIGANPRQRALDAAASAKEIGIYILTAGLTLSPSAQALMREIASNPEQSLNALKVDDLDGWFRYLDSSLYRVIELQSSSIIDQGGLWTWAALALILVLASLFEYRRKIGERLAARGPQGPPHEGRPSTVPAESPPPPTVPASPEPGSAALSSALEDDDIRARIAGAVLRMELTTCPSCGRSAPSSGVYCYSCGAILPPVAYCRNCRREVGREDKYCDACGTPIATTNLAAAY